MQRHRRDDLDGRHLADVAQGLGASVGVRASAVGGVRIRGCGGHPGSLSPRPIRFTAGSASGGPPPTRIDRRLHVGRPQVVGSGQWGHSASRAVARVGVGPVGRRVATDRAPVCTGTGAFLVSGSRKPARERLSPEEGVLISAETRINDRIRVPEVRLVGPNGEQVGIVRIEDALRLAQESDLDLVEVAPMARPPVAKLMDYGKFKYESAMKDREARKNQAHTIIKEMKLRPKIDQHDYETKKGHVVRFLKAGDKVKITIMFRGREQSRPELGFRLLQKLAEDVVRARLRRVVAQAGRPQHGDGPRTDPTQGRRDGRAAGRARDPQARCRRRVRRRADAEAEASAGEPPRAATSAE